MDFDPDNPEGTMPDAKPQAVNSALNTLLDLRDEFAIRILIGLMHRYNEPGYSDGAAISEAYSLAEQMIEHKKLRDEQKQKET